MEPIPYVDFDYHSVHTVPTPELEPYGTIDEDDDEDKDDEGRDHDYISVLPKHHHTFDEDDYFFSKTSGPHYTDEHYNEAETETVGEENVMPE